MRRVLLAIGSVLLALAGFTAGGLVATAQVEYVFINGWDEVEHTITPYTGGAKISSELPTPGVSEVSS